MVLIGLNGLIAFLSYGFEYGSPLPSRPIIGFVGVEILAGLVYLAAIWGCWKRPTGPRLLIWIVGAGALMRIAMFVSAPVQESDFYRYLWDGGMTAHGHNPYALAPRNAVEPGEKTPPSIGRLAEGSGPVVHRISFPHLRTIYPPVAQAAFAPAHWIGPWQLKAWRLVLLFCDLIVLAVLAALLREVGLPPAALALYWWNPLVIKEVVNSAHMDVLILPFILGAVLCVIKKRHLVAVVMLALAVGTKLWPVALLPILFRPLAARPKKLASVLGIFAALVLVLIVPYLLTASGENSGLLAYGTYWEMNDPLFMLLTWGVRPLTGALGGTAETAQLTTRVVTGLAFCGWIAWLAWQPAETAAGLCEKCLLAAAGLFLLSPTQFPWYALWFIPLLAVRPRFSLTVLSVLLPLYYLRFYFLGIDSPEVFDYGIVFAEFAPVWALVLREAWTRRRWPGLEDTP
jgi:hypothetical protein